jgi:hypothetical protein
MVVFFAAQVAMPFHHQANLILPPMTLPKLGNQILQIVNQEVTIYGLVQKLEESQLFLSSYLFP